MDGGGARVDENENFFSSTVQSQPENLSFKLLQLRESSLLYKETHLIYITVETGFLLMRPNQGSLSQKKPIEKVFRSWNSSF